MSSESPDGLAPLRKRIDSLDKQLVDLLNERANVVVEIGKVKQRDGHSPIYVPDRERQVLQQVVQKRLQKTDQRSKR